MSSQARAVVLVIPGSVGDRRDIMKIIITLNANYMMKY